MTDQDGKPARMPEGMLAPPPRYVRDMAMGEKQLIIFTEVLVSKKTLETYILPNTELASRGISRVLVEKTERGLIVTLPEDLKGHMLLRDGITRDALPVIEIRVVEEQEWRGLRGTTAGPGAV